LYRFLPPIVLPSNATAPDDAAPQAHDSLRSVVVLARTIAAEQHRHSRAGTSRSTPCRMWYGADVRVHALQLQAMARSLWQTSASAAMPR